MHSSKREGSVRVVLYEREELPPPAAERADCVYDRLTELDESGHVDETNRETWVKRAPIDDCNADLRDTYLAFVSWANAEGVRLTPFFQIRERFSTTTGDRTDWLVLPAFCLGIYNDNGVSAVYPHDSDEADARTVEDGLQVLLGDGRGEQATGPLVAD